MLKKTFFALTIAFALCFQAYGQANQAQLDPAKDFKTGLELFKKGKYNLAAEYFEQFSNKYAAIDVAKQSGYLSGAAFYKAVCAKKTQQNAAERMLLDYIATYPGTEGVYAANYHLGDFYFDKNNHKDAIKYFAETEIQALSKEEKNDYYFKYAYSFFALKNFREARSKFQVLVQNPSADQHQDAVYYAGLSAYYLNDYKDAFSHFKRIENATRYKNTIPYYLTAIHFINKEYDEVIAYAEPKLNDGNLRYQQEIKKLLGNAYFEKGNYRGAEKYLSESMAALSKVNQEDYYQLGYVYYKNLQYPRAVEQLKKLTFLENEMVQNAMYILGKSYSLMGDKTNAKNAFQQSARMKYKPEITEESAFNIAKLTYDLGNYTEALTLLKKFLDEYPRSKFGEEAQDIMADVFLKTRNYEEAISEIEKMKTPTAGIKSAYQKMAYFRATEYYSNNLFDKANLFLDKALKYKTDKSIEALTYYFKADIAHIQSKYEESNDWLKQFNALSSSISTDHSSRVSSGTGFYVQAYNSYKKKDFVSAQILFAKAENALKSEKDPAIQQSLYPDAVLRLADSYYMQKRYKDAIPHYQFIAQNKQRGADYATYQIAMLNGLSGNQSDKISGLKNVYQNFPQSAFADDALFELGSAYTRQNNPTEAINTYKTLFQSYPKSEFVPYAYNRVGLLQYNLDRPQDALATYKFVIQKYPQTPASQEALIAVKDIFINMGDAQGYLDLLKQYPGAMISTSAQDSLIYQAAEAQFVKGDYNKALSGFDAYVKSYPNGAFILPARFYRGECNNMTGKTNLAIDDYEFVIAQPTNRFTERSLLRASSIRFKDGTYNKAAMYYEALLDVAKTEDNQRDALMGAMRSYYLQKSYVKAIEFAERVSASKGISETVLTEAGFYRGMARMNLGETTGAIADLESTTKRINNEWAAEAKYYLAKIAYDKKDYKTAEKICFEFISTYPSYGDWLVRTYILLSDVYVAGEQYFQAKATLQSVLDNFDPEDALYKEASNKYNKVIELESKNSKLRTVPGTAGFSDFEN